MAAMGKVWFLFHAGLLVLASLWFVENPVWQLAWFLIALIGLAVNRVSWKIWLLRLAPILLFMLMIQLLLTPFYRPLVSAAWAGHFNFQDWWPLLKGLLRLATPFLAISAMYPKMTNPLVYQNIGQLSAPLKLLGFPVIKFRMLLPLILRFFPLVKQSNQNVRETLALFKGHRADNTGLRAKIRDLQIHYNALISRIIVDALQIGESLALRGWTIPRAADFTADDMFYAILWSGIGLLTWIFQKPLFFFWLIFSVWIGLTRLLSRDNINAPRTFD